MVSTHLLYHITHLLYLTACNWSHNKVLLVPPLQPPPPFSYTPPFLTCGLSPIGPCLFHPWSMIGYCSTASPHDVTTVGGIFVDTHHTLQVTKHHHFYLHGAVQCSAQHVECKAVVRPISFSTHPAFLALCSVILVSRAKLQKNFSDFGNIFRFFTIPV